MSESMADIEQEFLDAFTEKDTETQDGSLNLSDEDLKEEEIEDTEEEFFEEEETEEEEEEEEDNGVQTSSETETETETETEEGLNRLIGVPIRGGGKEITLESVDEVLTLVQKGLGYDKAVRKKSNAQRYAKALTHGGITSDEDLELAIQAFNGNPKAVQEIIKKLPSDVDVFELDTEAEKYTPTNRIVKSKDEYDLEDTLSSVQNDALLGQHYDTLMQELQANVIDVSDDVSSDAIQQNPNLIRAFAEEIASGNYNKVKRHMDRKSLLGGDWNYTEQSFIERYRQANAELNANTKTSSNPRSNGKRVISRKKTLKKQPDHSKVASPKSKSNSPNSLDLKHLVGKRVSLDKWNELYNEDEIIKQLTQ